MVTTTPEPRPHLPRWFGWLLAGVGVGLFLGFAVGLTRPHARR